MRNNDRGAVVKRTILRLCTGRCRGARRKKAYEYATDSACYQQRRLCRQGTAVLDTTAQAARKERPPT